MAFMVALSQYDSIPTSKHTYVRIAESGTLNID